MISRRFFLLGSAAFTALSVVDRQRVLAGTLDILSGDREYFVRTDGDDGNTGTTNTPGGAWRTLQHAYDQLADTVFLAGHKVKIEAGAGSFVGLRTAREILGVGLPGDVTVEGVGSSTTITRPTVGQFCFELGIGQDGQTTLLIDNLRLVNDLGGGGIGASGCSVQYSNIRFGTIMGSHIEASHGAWVYQKGPSTIEGSPYTSYAHLAAASHGIIAVHSQYLEFTGARTFTGAVAAARSGGQIYTSPMTVYGGANVTGRPYDVSAQASVDGISNLPGSMAGYCHALGFVS